MTKTGLFTHVIDALETYLNAQYNSPTATVLIFQGSKTIGDMITGLPKAISLNITNWQQDPNGMNGFWVVEVNVIYMHYNPSATDAYDIISEAEAIIDKIETHLHSQYNTSPNEYDGRNVAGKVWSITDESKNFLYGCEMTFKINLAEVT